MTRFEIVSEPEVEAEIQRVFDWYEDKVPGLGTDFLDELRAAYERLLAGPFKYSPLRGSIRRVLTRRFPYAVYFSIEGNRIVVLTVLHFARDPDNWRKRAE